MTRTVFLVAIFLYALAVLAIPTRDGRGANAKRMARGLPPLPPRKLYEATRSEDTAAHSHPSSGVCPKGHSYCCFDLHPFSHKSSFWHSECGIHDVSSSTIIGEICLPMILNFCPFGTKRACCDGFKGKSGDKCSLGLSCKAY